MQRAAITNVRTIVRRVEAAGHGVKLFSLEDEDGWELPPARPGAHIDLFLPNKLLRTYSLCNGPRHRTRYEVAVKREAAGRGGSAILHDRVTEGDVIGVSLPRGGLALPAGTTQVFLAGGIGVTPFLSAADALLDRGDSDWILHVLARREPPLARHLAPFLERGLAVWHDTSAGRPDLPALIGAARRNTRVSCCGPVAMLEAFEAATAAWPSEQVHVERFVPPVLAPDPEAAPYTLVLAKTNRSIDVPIGMPMIEAIARCGSTFRPPAAGASVAPAKLEYSRASPCIVTASCRRPIGTIACSPASRDARGVSSSWIFDGPHHRPTLAPCLP